MRGEAISISGSRRKGPKEYGPAVSLFVVALIAIAYVLALPFLPIVVYWERRKKRVLARAMTRQNRTLLWTDFARALEGKRGTLIVEGDPRKDPNLWWTPEDIRLLSPHPCSDDLSSLFNRSYRPFMRWCFERHTSPSSGSAFLVLGGEGQRRGFAIGSEEDESGTGIFQNMPTVLMTNRRT
jgi:hypothetical protein